MNRFLRLLFVTLGFMAAAAASAPARAITDGTFIFGDLLSGSFQPSSTFATLSVTQTDSNQYSFTLTTLDLNSIIAPNAFIGALALNSVPDPANPPVPPVIVGPVAPPDGVSSVTSSAGGGPTGTWDWRINFGSGQDRLGANETVRWVAALDYDFEFANDLYATGSNAFAVHVQGIGAVDPAGSAWYTPPIPEPEIYAMLLAGLGLMGFIANRRRQTLAEA